MILRIYYHFSQFFNLLIEPYLWFHLHQCPLQCRDFLGLENSIWSNFQDFSNKCNSNCRDFDKHKWKLQPIKLQWWSWLKSNFQIQWDLIGNKIPKNSLNFCCFSPFGLLIHQWSGSYFPIFSGLPLIHLKQFWCLYIQKVQLCLQSSIIDWCIFGILKLQNYPLDCKMCQWILLLIPKISAKQ